MAPLGTTPIEGRNLHQSTIGQIISEKQTFLVFLRHLGCNLTLQLVSDIDALEKKIGVKLPIVYISQGSKNYCDLFWSTNYPSSSVIYDHDLLLAKSFGLKQGTFGDVVNPKAMICSLRAMVNGHIPTGSKGNVFMLPGVFVYSSGREVFKHIATHAGDLPDFEKLILKFLEIKMKTTQAS